MQSKPEVFNIPLHDIKPLIEIQEYSLEYLIALSIVGFVLLMGLSYLLYRYLKNKNKFNIRAEHLKLLQKLSLEDTKTAAYKITLYGLTFKDDSLRHKQNYETLVDALESYKYKKNVEKFDEEIKHQLERYIGMLDV